MFSKLLPLALLASAAQAQFASYSQGDYSISVNVPEDTASRGSGAIFFEISAPSDTAWVGFGQGTRMAGSHMFIVYSDGADNVTVSPRLGSGYFEPQFTSDTQLSVLEGSGVQSGGSLIARVRCDNCLEWDGGSMDPTDSSSSWIWGYSGGSALDSTSTSQSIRQHSRYGAFSLDLSQGIGGSSANPFIAATSGPNTDSNSDLDSASPSGTADASVPISSSNANNNAGSTVADNTVNLRRSHAIIMSVTFVLVFPLAALTLYLPWAKRVLFVHAPLQTIGLILMIVGLGTGVVLADRADEMDGYHQIIGYIVVASLIAFQPALGIMQHIYFRRNSARSMMGVIHQWLGRTMIVFGMVNGGLGFRQSGPVGSPNVPRAAVIAYSVIAAIVAVVYAAVLFFASRRPMSPDASRAPRSQGGNWQSELQPISTAKTSPSNSYRQQSHHHGSHEQPWQSEQGSPVSITQSESHYTPGIPR